MPAPKVSLRGIWRRFGPVVANRNVSLELAPGTIHALVGENGAGKSTLMRMLYGLLPPDQGEIRVADRPVRLGRPADAMRLGIGMVHAAAPRVAAPIGTGSSILPTSGGVLPSACPASK